MTASLRGLVALAAIAIALAVGVAVHRGAPPIDRAILPGFTGDAHELRWQRAIGDMRIAREGDHWLMGTSRARHMLDPRAVDAILATLRGARWQRRAERARAGAIHETLFVDGRAVSIGASVPGADQTWLVVGDHALLVDGWVARALEPSALSLVEREPLAGAAGSAELRVGELVLRGVPLRSALGVVAPARVAALTSALDAAEIVRLPTGSAAGTTVQLGSAAPIVVGGPCATDAPDLVALHANTGDGCITEAAWHAITDAAAALASPDALDPRPAGFPIAGIAIGSAAVDLANGDADRIAELVAALGEPGALVPVPAGAPLRTLTITPRGGGPIALDIYAGAVRRRDEPRAIAISPSAQAVLARPAHAFANPTRWAEDPSVVARLVLDGAVFDRGAALGEWTRGSGSAPVDPQLLDALAAAAASVRAPDASLPPGFRPAHRLAVTLAPPVGARVTHELELGPPSPTGCAARIDGAPVTAPPALCLAVAAAAH